MDTSKNKYRLPLQLFLIAVLFLSNPKYAWAGAWTIAKGKIWNLTQFRWAKADDSFDAKGKKIPLANDGRKKQFSVLVKTEYGLEDWLNPLLYLDYKDLDYKEYEGQQTYKHSGVDNVQVGFKLRILKEPFMLTLQPKGFIATDYHIFRTDNAFELRVLSGKEFKLPIAKDFLLHGYLKLESGYCWRSRGIADDIPYYACLGFWPKERVLLNAEIDGYQHSPGTGGEKVSTGIWRAGFIWQIVGNSTLRQGAKILNIQFQYGQTAWGKNANAYDEYLLSIHTAF
jgi:hypothetical protein